MCVFPDVDIANYCQRVWLNIVEMRSLFLKVSASIGLSLIIVNRIQHVSSMCLAQHRRCTQLCLEITVTEHRKNCTGLFQILGSETIKCKDGSTLAARNH